eukprot:TRINITY_DN40353_c0_g1_i1.p1 TRINITY_DN40353_c0_g1~~TRINITY_DN40353_c0_g1_i1.p1  ORF type:complete len:254 (+),score=46.57 TRINITY_DN40353_c0_g1_i1:51-764(+)
MSGGGLSEMDLIDPCPDVHALFLRYNTTQFEGKLDAVYVEWSKRMTLCAGLCTYDRRTGGCGIKLSAPLLKLRPAEDTVNTLLHECIHAYLFVTKNNADRDDHGPAFQALMNRINASLGTSITIYHSFTNEVDYYRTHWWQCTSCLNICKRSMNRAPSPRDPWYLSHLKNCGGNYVKIKEPEKKKKEPAAGSKRKKTATPTTPTQPDKKPRIDALLKRVPEKAEEKKPQPEYIEISD